MRSLLAWAYQGDVHHDPERGLEQVAFLMLYDVASS